MKKFSKINYLQKIGLLRRKFNDGEFSEKKSIYLSIRSYFIAIVTVLSSSKIFVSLFFDLNDEWQMYIGNTYNYLDESPRFFFGLAVSF